MLRGVIMRLAIVWSLAVDEFIIFGGTTRTETSVIKTLHASDWIVSIRISTSSGQPRTICESYVRKLCVRSVCSTAHSANDIKHTCTHTCYQKRFILG